MSIIDIHSHILAHLDDGPKEIDEMYTLLDASYQDGARCICCTPHYHPGCYGNNVARSLEMFRLLKQYALEKYPDLQLCLGNELHYSQGCIKWVQDGLCRTLNGTRYILIDFDYNEPYQVIEFAVLSFLRQGYIPVLAHIERYPSLHGKNKLVIRLHDIGAILQVNASSVLRLHRYPHVKKMFRQGIVDVIASDVHNLRSRPSNLLASYFEISQKYGETYANKLFFYNPSIILNIQNEMERCADE